MIRRLAAGGFMAAALVLLAGCPKPVTGALAQTSVYLSDELESSASGRAQTVARLLPASMREALKARGYKLVTNPNIPHDLTARLKADLSDEMGLMVNGSASLIVEAGGQVVDQIDVSLHSNGFEFRRAEEYAYYLAHELAEQLNTSHRVAQFAEGVRPTAVATKPAVTKEVTGGVPGTFATGAPQPNAWALIVGVEKYRDAPAATGARADAEAFAALARTSLGIPEEHIQTALDDRASRGDLEKHLKWIATNARSGDRIYLYFSGHGAPEPTSGTSYLLPYDGDPRALDETAVKLSHVVAALEQTKSAEVLIVLDSCFSGAGGRSVLPPGARPLVPTAKAISTSKVALFTAASGAEISGPAPDGKHGLFTATVLEAVGAGKADTDGDGQLSLKELAEWVRPRVARQAKKDLREQTPSLTLGQSSDAAKFVVTSGIK